MTNINKKQRSFVDVKTAEEELLKAFGLKRANAIEEELYCVENPWLYENPKSDDLEMKDINTLAYELGHDVAKDKYEKLCNKAIYKLRRIKTNRPNDDLFEKNWYREFAYRIHNGEDAAFYDWGFITETVEDVCFELVDNLPEKEQRFLWFYSDGFNNHNCNDNISINDIIHEVSDELYKTVYYYAEADNSFIE